MDKLEGPSKHDKLDEKFEILSNGYRRRLIDYLSQEGSADVEELTRLLEDVGYEEDNIRVQLEHAHLPKMDDLDIINYDRVSGFVEYEPDQLVEDLLEQTEKHI